MGKIYHFWLVRTSNGVRFYVEAADINVAWQRASDKAIRDSFAKHGLVAPGEVVEIEASDIPPSLLFGQDLPFFQDSFWSST